MDRLTIKSSTIFIATGDKTSVYRSMDEVPAPLRKKLQESTNGINAATILIADRRGREEIVRAIQGLPNSIRGRLTSTLGAARRPEVLKKLDWRTALELVLAGAVGLLIWLAFNFR